MKFIILLFVVFASVSSQEDKCDQIQDLVASKLSPIKTFIDDQSVKFEKKINLKLYDAVSSLVTCNATLGGFLHSFLKTNNVESLANFSNALENTVVSSYDKIRANFTQGMVAIRSTDLNENLYKTIQVAVQTKTKELEALIAVKAGDDNCFFNVFKTSFIALTDTFIPDLTKFLVETRDQKISEKWEQFMNSLKKLCDDITKEVNHCKETTFMTCCLDAYLIVNQKDILKQFDLGSEALELESNINAIYDEERLMLAREINTKFEDIFVQLETCI
ncbi:unnamed protein product [Diamesa serratosioi]